MRRLWKRHACGDDGLSLIETVAALVVFALIMSGLAAGMALFAHNAELTKARNAATAMAQQIMESAKTIPLNQLAVCIGGGADGKTYKYQGDDKPILTGTTPCLPYTSNRTNSGINFTVQQVIFKYGTGAAGNQPLVDKMLVVTVSWSAPSPGSYTTHTLVSGNDVSPTQIPVGLRINVNDSSGNLVTLPNLTWKYTVSNAAGVVADGDTDDGTSGLLSVSPGNYTCTLTPENDAGASYDPVAATGVTITPETETMTTTTLCQVNPTAITDWNTTWSEVTDCASSGSKATSVQITVYDQNNQPVPTASVYLTNVGTGANAGKVSSTLTTGSTGVVTFAGADAPTADLYTYTISKVGYTTSSGSQVCIPPGVATTGLQGTISAQSTCTVSKTLKGSVTVTVVDTSDPAQTVTGARIQITNQDGNGQPGAQNSLSDGTYTFTNVVAGNYTVTVTKTGYVNLGPQGPFCVAGGTGAQTPYTATLPSSGSQNCTATSSKGVLQIKVVDGNNAPIGNVKITLTNANGHGGVPPAKTTDPTTGIATWDGKDGPPGDLYTYVVTVPAGYSNPGTQGPLCVAAGSTVNSSQVKLLGIMTAKVTVQNKDTQPTKTYTVKVTDSNGALTTNSVTVNKNKSGTVTFSNMPTDTYSVVVCVQVAISGNCDPVAPASSQNWGTKGQTYALTVQDSQGSV